MKIYHTIKIAAFLIVCFSFCSKAIGQPEPVPVKLYNTYEEMKEFHPDMVGQEHLDNKFLKGSVVIAFPDSSFITPDGIYIQLELIQENNERMMVSKAITDNKGKYYLKGVKTGNYCIKVHFKRVNVISKYFSLSDPGSIELEQIILPVEELEMNVQQKKDYEEF